MPARDADYMEKERRKIAGATYEAALEKGLAGTSLRDICNRAGVSMGGFYVHFKSKDEAIVAAFYLVREQADRPVIESWQALAKYLRTIIEEATTSPRRRRETRLFYEYLGSALRGDGDPGSRYQSSEESLRWWKEQLDPLHSSGELQLPLGLNASAQACYYCFMGVLHVIAMEPKIDARAAVNTNITALELMLGYQETRTDRRLKPDGRR